MRARRICANTFPDTIESHNIVYRMAPFSMTLNDLNPHFKFTPVFNTEYLINGARYRHSYNELLIGIYVLLKQVISNYLE